MNKNTNLGRKYLVHWISVIFFQGKVIFASRLSVALFFLIERKLRLKASIGRYIGLTVVHVTKSAYSISSNSECSKKKKYLCAPIVLESVAGLKQLLFVSNLILLSFQLLLPSTFSPFHFPHTLSQCS